MHGGTKCCALWEIENLVISNLTEFKIPSARKGIIKQETLVLLIKWTNATPPRQTPRKIESSRMGGIPKETQTNPTQHKGSNPKGSKDSKGSKGSNPKAPTQRIQCKRIQCTGSNPKDPQTNFSEPTQPAGSQGSTDLQGSADLQGSTDLQDSAGPQCSPDSQAHDA
ncbi:hypothetical protein BS47DRAFT_1362065 [Hydnum rufescens UP504]|uniref:Uncharacterized protein n=1 Tax=Hydnum rufescens UP504 TaxID=1448309 RepID=A0A9P6DWU1_9AGAM|nr:hypothetical protein BS47DRAFT_1362065 [Hydnum rufescens UP504]